MSGLDATFLYFETPNMHMHVIGVIVFDPSTVPGGYSFDLVKEMMQKRLHLVPTFRRKLAPIPFNLNHPVWVEDAYFDLDYHVRRIGCPAPGSERELAEIVGDEASRPLDRSRPLWEMVIVEGLQNGYVASISKMHHATIDGVSGSNLMVHLFDLEPEPAEQPELQPWTPERMPSDIERFAYAAVSRLRRPLNIAKVIPQTAKSVLNVVQRRRGGASGGMAAPFSAPRTSFNAPVTPHRRVAFSTTSLEEVKEIKRAFGATVNDVVLAICSGALRRYLSGRGELPDKSLIATCPVSVRGDDEKQVGSNQVSAMFTSLNTDIEDPVERLMAIHEANRNAKEEHHAVGADLLQNWAEFAAPTTFSLAARVYSGLRLAERHPVIHNLVISNVPGPPFPLYFAGAKLVGLNPLGPIMDGAGLNITVLSYVDNINWGFIACRELMPDLWDLASA
ncbi:MAG: WS/DGAT/MGAT family O-acyltransferase, partial [Actinomycetota bacterium]